MKIVIAPDAFKESLAAPAVARAIAAGFAQVLPQAQYLLRPLADGGEGTVEALVAASGGELREAVVTGPLGEAVTATFGLLGGGHCAVMEMAAASGLPLVPLARRNPLLTTSYGTGELIRHALDLGVSRLILGIGGSATNDGGAGLIQALGGRLLDDEGASLGPGGGALADLASIDLSGLDPRLATLDLQVACDVDNPLCGPRGASQVFGPQKGATPNVVAQLDANLAHYAACIASQLGKEVAQLPGAGAAGGMGAALAGLLGAQLTPGIELVLQALDMDEVLEGADLVITGEGRLDGQTLYGKVPLGVARLARSNGVPVIALAGCLGPGHQALYAEGIAALFAIVDRPMELAEALLCAEENLRRTARNLAAIWALGR